MRHAGGMCGRYALVRDVSAIEAEFGTPPPERLLAPDANIAPTRDVYVVRVAKPGPEEEPGRRLDVARWGLVPSWAKDVSVGQRMINARSESVGERPSYRGPFARRRCLLPADAFYEWAPVAGGPKQPYLFRAADGSVLALAGLYDWWRDPALPAEDPASWLLSTTILTTAARGAPAEVHDRMPVVVPGDLRGGWLDPDLPGAEVLPGILAGASDGFWESYPVSRAVNSARSHGVELMERESARE